MMKLYILDMDGTLIDHDCDVSWKEFLVAEGIAPRSDLELAEKFFAERKAKEERVVKYTITEA